MNECRLRTDKWATCSGQTCTFALCPGTFVLPHRLIRTSRKFVYFAPKSAIATVIRNPVYERTFGGLRQDRATLSRDSIVHMTFYTGLSTELSFLRMWLSHGTTKVPKGGTSVRREASCKMESHEKAPCCIAHTLLRVPKPLCTIQNRVAAALRLTALYWRVPSCHSQSSCARTLER